MSNTPEPAPKPAWDAIARVLDESHRFLLATHVNPDGDGLGAELGLHGHLTARGKDVRVVNQHPLPERYGFLEPGGVFETYDAGRHDAMIADREVVIVLDMSRWDRLGALGDKLRAGDPTVICIDHHPYEGGGMAHLYGVDVTAAATGQLIHELICRLGHDVDPRMALGLYVSIVTDTGSFRFSNSDSRVHRAAAELLETGIAPHEVYEAVYGNFGPERLRLQGRVMNHMRITSDGRIIVLSVSRRDLAETGAEAEDAEGFVDVARSVSGCAVVVLLTEREDGRIKVSMRSRGEVNVREAALQLEGGGHVYAAGAVMDGPLDAAADRVVGLFPSSDATLGNA